MKDEDWEERMEALKKLQTLINDLNEATTPLWNTFFDANVQKALIQQVRHPIVPFFSLVLSANGHLPCGPHLHPSPLHLPQLFSKFKLNMTLRRMVLIV